MSIDNSEWHHRNIETYNTSAAALATYYAGIGARSEDIDRGLALAKTGPNSRVVEIGCGDGRDAEVITKKASWYEGVDPSSGLLAIARQRLPTITFIEADALTYDYPTNIDVIYAFASLLHISRESMPKVFAKAHQSLKAGGVFYLSLKERAEYTEEIKKDQYGERMFYYYNSRLIKEYGGLRYRSVYEDRQTIGHTDWFTLALRKC